MRFPSGLQDLLRRLSSFKWVSMAFFTSPGNGSTGSLPPFTFTLRVHLPWLQRIKDVLNPHASHTRRLVLSMTSIKA
jgi:hypothetical protein